MITTQRVALVTGGAGFIGGALVRALLAEQYDRVVTFDKLTYAANPLARSGWPHDPRHELVIADICNAAAVSRAIATHQPTVVFHLAAETHVDRSIDAARPFVETNVVGTQVLLDACTSYWRELPEPARSAFRFVHCSTDEVFGCAGPDELFSETTPYAPSSPYAASKAASDHLVRAWHATYGLPTLISNCGNNYGPWQFPEKLIPHMIVRALRGDSLPVYGNGLQQRDWIFVDDHASALCRIASHGAVGRTYLVGARDVHTNRTVVDALCVTLDQFAPRADGLLHASAIAFVTDRPGHDTRYALDPSRIEHELNWSPLTSMAHGGLDATVQWYLEHASWWRAILDGAYDASRLGLGTRS